MRTPLERLEILEDRVRELCRPNLLTIVTAGRHKVHITGHVDNVRVVEERDDGLDIAKMCADPLVRLTAAEWEQLRYIQDQEERRKDCTHHYEYVLSPGVVRCLLCGSTRAY
jgi:hypothetical protein